MHEHPTTPPPAPTSADEELSAGQLAFLGAAIERGHVARLLDLLGNLIDDVPCHFDHNHSCQTHLYFYLAASEQCPMAEAKAALIEAGRGGETHA